MECSPNEEGTIKSFFFSAVSKLQQDEFRNISIREGKKYTVKNGDDSDH